MNNIITYNQSISVDNFWELSENCQDEIREQFYCNTDEDFEDWQFFKVAGNWYELSEGLPHQNDVLPDNWEGKIEMRDGGTLYIKPSEDSIDGYNDKIIVGIDW
jgi:hypothetical protein